MKNALQIKGRGCLAFYVVFFISNCCSFIFLNNIPEAAVNAKDVYFIITSGAFILFFSGALIYRGKKVVVDFNITDICVVLYHVFVIVNYYIKGDFRPTPCSLVVIVVNLYFYVLIRYLFSISIISKQTVGKLILLIAGLQCLIGLLQLSHVIPSLNSNFVITGSFFNPAPFAIFLAILNGNILTDILFGIYKWKINFHFLLKCIVFVLSLTLIILCDSRSAIIGLIAGIIYIYFQLYRSIGIKISKRKYLFIILTLVLSFAFFVIYKKESSLGRILIWRTCWSILKEHFLTGVGRVQFSIFYTRLQADILNDVHSVFSDLKIYSGDVRFAFNDALDILCKDGIVGLVLFSGALFFVIVSPNRNVNAMLRLPDFNFGMIGFKSMLIILIISGLFSYPLSILPINIFYYFIIIFLSCNQKYYIFKLNYRGFFIIAITGVFISGFFFIGYGVNRYISLKKWNNLSYLNNSSSSKWVELSYILSDNTLFLLNMSEALIREKDYKNALIFLKRAKAISPNNRIYYNIGYIYERCNNFVEAEKYYNIIKRSNPNLLKPHYLLAKIYYRTNQCQKFVQEYDYIYVYIPKISSDEITLMKMEIENLKCEGANSVYR